MSRILENLRSQDQVECPACDGRGCKLCDGHGYVYRTIASLYINLVNDGLVTNDDGTPMKLGRKLRIKEL